MGIADLVRSNDPRAEGTEGVIALPPKPLPVPALGLALGDVIEACVATDESFGVGLGHAVTRSADHNQQLALVVKRDIALRHLHRGIGPDDAAGDLGEQPRSW